MIQTAKEVQFPIVPKLKLFDDTLSPFLHSIREGTGRAPNL